MKPSRLFPILVILLALAISGAESVHAQSAAATNPASTAATNPASTAATNPASTAATNPGTTGTLQNPLKESSLSQLLTDILGAVVDIGAIVLAVMLVWVGFMFVTARGNEEKIREARSALIWTVIGGLILLGAQAISTVVQNTVSAL